MQIIDCVKLELYTNNFGGVQSWREITSGGTRTKNVEHHYLKTR
jgi:hypothetical protein